MNSPRPALHIGKVLPPPYAGIESHIEQLLPSLSPEIDCHLLVSEVGWRRRRGAPRPYKVWTARTVLRAASTALNPGMPLIMRRWARAYPSGLVHLHLPNPMGDLSARLVPRNMPLVVTWHSDIIRQKRLLKLYWPVLRSLLDRADRIITFTPRHIESSTQLKHVGSEKLRVVPVGIDPSGLEATAEVEHAIARWRERVGARRMIFTLGRHVYYKGYSYLIDAMQGMPDDVVLVLGGNGPLTDSLKQQADCLGISDRVLFAGTISDADKVALMRLCDVFCLPSIEPSEAFGMATAEAMLCGKPAVVCDLGNGVNYLNRPGVTGLTVPARDAPSLRKALQELLSDERLRLRMGSAAQEWVSSEFSMEAMRRGTLRVYEELR